MRLGSALALAGLAVVALPGTASAKFTTTASSSFFYSNTRHGGGLSYGGSLNNFWLHFPGAWGIFHQPQLPRGHRGFGHRPGRGWNWGGWGQGHGVGPGGSNGPGPTTGNPGGPPGGTIGGPGDPPPVVTPEPLSMTLLATGLAGVGAARARRRKTRLD